MGTDGDTLNITVKNVPDHIDVKRKDPTKIEEPNFRDSFTFKISERDEDIVNGKGGLKLYAPVPPAK